MSDENIKEEQVEDEVVDAVEADSAEIPTPETEEPPRELTLEEQLEQAQQQSAENLEGWQRARAEFANARKRFDQQKTAARTNALVEIAEQLLPVIDDFDLAFKEVPEEISSTDWYGGVGLIPKKFSTILEKINIERIESVGHPFDPTMHNAIMREASEEFESNTVIREFQGGFKIGERVIRPAVVVVSE